MGYYGVCVFFVISGYLITGISLKRYGTLPEIDFSGFWWLRFSRIVPMLLSCCLFMIFCHICKVGGFIYKDTASLARTLASIFSFRYYEVAGTDPAQASWAPLWSLSVEEMFYFVFPFACLCLNGVGAVIWLYMMVFASALYLKLSAIGGVFSTLACMDLLALGSLVAVCRPERLGKTIPEVYRFRFGTALLLGGLGLIAFCTCRWHPFTAFTFAPLLCGIGAACILISSTLLNVGRLVALLLLPLTSLGVVSYEAYLLHMPCIRYLDTVSSAGPAATLAIIILSYAVDCNSEWRI